MYGYLPMPTNQQENDFLQSLGSTWLKLNVKEEASRKKIKDVYSNWENGEPNNRDGDGDRIQLLVGWNYWKMWNGKWNDGSSEIPTTCYLKVKTGEQVGKFLTKFTCTSDSHCLNSKTKFGPNLMCNKNYQSWNTALEACHKVEGCLGLVRYKTGDSHKWELVAKKMSKDVGCASRNNMAQGLAFFPYDNLAEMASDSVPSMVRTAIPNSNPIGCVKNEACSATWIDGSSFLCSGHYSSYNFAQSSCQQLESCDMIYEVMTEDGVHWELISKTTPRCKYINDFEYNMLPKNTPVKLMPNNGLSNAPTTTKFKTSVSLEKHAVLVNNDMYADGVLLSCASNSICVTTADIEKTGNLLCKKSYLERMKAKAACNESKNCIGLLKYISGNETRYEVVTIGHVGNRCPLSNQLVRNKSLLYRIHI